MSLHIELVEDDNGAISCLAHVNGEELDKHAIIRAVGMLEIAKASLLMGRWGVLDSKPKKRGKPAIGVAMPSMVEKYIQARVAEELAKVKT